MSSLWLCWWLFVNHWLSNFSWGGLNLGSFLLNLLLFGGAGLLGRSLGFGGLGVLLRLCTLGAGLWFGLLSLAGRLSSLFTLGFLLWSLTLFGLGSRFGLFSLSSTLLGISGFGRFLLNLTLFLLLGLLLLIVSLLLT